MATAGCPLRAYRGLSPSTSGSMSELVASGPGQGRTAWAVLLLPHTLLQAAVGFFVRNDGLLPSEMFYFFSGQGCPGVNGVFALLPWSLSPYCAPGPVPGAGDSTTNKSDEAPCPLGTHVLLGWLTILYMYVCMYVCMCIYIIF